MANYIVLEMDLNDKWWDKWFVVGGLSIDRGIQLNHYNYFSMSSVYMLTRGEDMAKKEFFVRKPRRNLKGFWSKLDIIGIIDDFGGLLCEVYKFCGDNIYCVTDPRVPDRPVCLTALPFLVATFLFLKDEATCVRSGICVVTCLPGCMWTVTIFFFNFQFCGPCLRNRYGEDAREALKDPVCSSRISPLLFCSVFILQ